MQRWPRCWSGPGYRWVRRSEWRAAAEINPLLSPGQIVLLDTIGELASVYSLAAVAFVGGSLVPAGGHNPLEPAQFGVPIVMGPHYANFRAITEDLLAARRPADHGKAELARILLELLCNPGDAEAMGERARQVFAARPERPDAAWMRSRNCLGEGGATA